MIKSDLPPQPRDFASEFDPVLHGVARGLSDLFPPIYAAVEGADEDADAAFAEGGGAADTPRQ